MKGKEDRVVEMMTGKAQETPVTEEREREKGKKC